MYIPFFRAFLAVSVLLVAVAFPCIASDTLSTHNKSPQIGLTLNHPAFGLGLVPKDGCYSFRARKKASLFFGIYGGLAAPLRSIEPRFEEFRAYADLRNARENPKVEYHLGGYVGIEVFRGVTAEVGVEWARIQEEYKLSELRTDTTGFTTNTQIIVNSPGDTLFLMDTTYQIGQVIFDEEHQNRYSLLSFPLSVGYQLPYGGRFMPYIKAGAAFNLMLRHRVSINDASTGQVVTYEDNDGPFVERLGIIPWVRLGTFFGLTDNISVFAEVRYQHISRSFTPNTFLTTQKYRLPGFSIGVQHTMYRTHRLRVL